MDKSTHIPGAKEYTAQAITTAEAKQRIMDILKGWQFDRRSHGSLYDRGSADSYYGRTRDPHYGGVGGTSGHRVSVNDEASVAEYMAGYNYNDQYGDKKNYD